MVCHKINSNLKANLFQYIEHFGPILGAIETCFLSHETLLHVFETHESKTLWNHRITPVARFTILLTRKLMTIENANIDVIDGIKIIQICYLKWTFFLFKIIIHHLKACASRAKLLHWSWIIETIWNSVTKAKNDKNRHSMKKLWRCFRSIINFHRPKCLVSFFLSSSLSKPFES